MYVIEYWSQPLLGEGQWLRSPEIFESQEEATEKAKFWVKNKLSPKCQVILITREVVVHVS